MDKKQRRERKINFLKSVFSDAKWFRFPKNFLKHMRADEAVMLSFLINLSTAPRKRKWFLPDEEWFQCSSKYMEDELHTARTNQWRLIQSLIKMRFLRSKRFGPQNRRAFCIRWGALWKVMFEPDELL